MYSKRGAVLGAVAVSAFALGAAPSAAAAAPAAQASGAAHHLAGPAKPKCGKGEACVYLNSRMVLHTGGDWGGGAVVLKATRVVNAGQPSTYDRIDVRIRDSKGRNTTKCVNRGEGIDFKGYVRSVTWVSHC